MLNGMVAGGGVGDIQTEWVSAGLLQVFKGFDITSGGDDETSSSQKTIGEGMTYAATGSCDQNDSWLLAHKLLHIKELDPAYQSALPSTSGP
ncbi:hypothetical protein GCM10025776_05680 [Corallincola platygyrae]